MGIKDYVKHDLKPKRVWQWQNCVTSFTDKDDGLWQSQYMHRYLKNNFFDKISKYFKIDVNLNNVFAVFYGFNWLWTGFDWIISRLESIFFAKLWNIRSDCDEKDQYLFKRLWLIRRSTFWPSRLSLWHRTRRKISIYSIKKHEMSLQCFYINFLGKSSFLEFLRIVRKLPINW